MTFDDVIMTDLVSSLGPLFGLPESDSGAREAARLRSARSGSCQLRIGVRTERKASTARVHCTTGGGEDCVAHCAAAIARAKLSQPAIGTRRQHELPRCSL